MNKCSSLSSRNVCRDGSVYQVSYSAPTGHHDTYLPGRFVYDQRPTLWEALELRESHFHQIHRLWPGYVKIPAVFRPWPEPMWTNIYPQPERVR